MVCYYWSHLKKKIYEIHTVGNLWFKLNLIDLVNRVSMEQSQSTEVPTKVKMTFWFDQTLGIQDARFDLINRTPSHIIGICKVAGLFLLTCPVWNKSIIKDLPFLFKITKLHCSLVGLTNLQNTQLFLIFKA